MPSILSFLVAVHSVVHLASAAPSVQRSEGDAGCRDDASMLQLQATSQLEEQGAKLSTRKTDTCTLDPLSSWKGVDWLTTQHDNVVNIFNAQITQLVGCTFCVTDGQPWEGAPPLVQTHDGTGITIQAGRKKSADAANCFLNMQGWPTEPDFNPLGEASLIGLNSQPGLVPQELNFAIKTTMFLSVPKEYPYVWNFVCHDIRLAQGSSDGNNWWLGCSKGAKSQACLACPCEVEDTGAPVLVNFCPPPNNVNNAFNVVYNA